MSLRLFLRFSLYIRDSALWWSVMGHTDGVRPDVVVTMSALFRPRSGGENRVDLAHRSLIVLQKGQNSSFMIIQTGTGHRVHAGQSAEAQMLQTVGTRLSRRDVNSAQIENTETNAFQLNSRSFSPLLPWWLIYTECWLSKQTCSDLIVIWQSV